MSLWQVVVQPHIEDSGQVHSLSSKWFTPVKILNSNPEAKHNVTS